MTRASTDRHRRSTAGPTVPRPVHAVWPAAPHLQSRRLKKPQRRPGYSPPAPNVAVSSCFKDTRPHTIRFTYRRRLWFNETNVPTHQSITSRPRQADLHTYGCRKSPKRAHGTRYAGTPKTVSERRNFHTPARRK